MRNRGQILTHMHSSTRTHSTCTTAHIYTHTPTLVEAGVILEVSLTYAATAIISVTMTPAR